MRIGFYWLVGFGFDFKVSRSFFFFDFINNWDSFGVFFYYGLYFGIFFLFFFGRCGNREIGEGCVWFGFSVTIFSKVNRFIFSRIICFFFIDWGFYVF